MAKQYPAGYFRSSRDGYCRHGVYVGGIGADYICGRCESGEDSRPHAWRDEYRYADPVYVVSVNGGTRHSLRHPREALGLIRIVRECGGRIEYTKIAQAMTGWQTLFGDSVASNWDLDAERRAVERSIDRHYRRHAASVVRARERRRAVCRLPYSTINTIPGDVGARDTF